MARLTALHIKRRPQGDVHVDWPQHIPPLLRRVYAARGICQAQQVEYRLAQLARPDGLAGMAHATAVLQQAIAEQQSILIAGDYDCDGATGVAVAVRGLGLLGASRVSYVVPHRGVHGYGLSPALLDSLSSSPDLIVTVDNGIASLAGVAAANKRGIRVIVTDHHVPGSTLPEAEAIVNPQLPGDAFAGKSLAGVGVMFYLLLALRVRMRETGAWQNGQPDLASLLDLVALGTVADMVPLERNNRILVEAGLRRMRAGQCCSGVCALAAVSKRSLATLTAADLGFALAPRLNAAGRLEDMSIGIECLLSDEQDRAGQLAQTLSAINSERRQLQADMLAEAETVLTDDCHTDASGVVVFEPHWHAGVVGLVASRLKERLHRPVVAFAPSGNGDGTLRGSARSISGLHIRDALAVLDTRWPGLITRFGGHAMAAGLELPSLHLASFSEAFDSVAAEMLDDDALQAVLWSDGELSTRELVLECARSLRFAGPWGQGFAAPLFDNVFDCVQQAPMGSGHRRVQLRDPRNGMLHDAVMFNVSHDLPMSEPLRVVYELSVNDWNNRERLRLLLHHVEQAL